VPAAACETARQAAGRPRVGKRCGGDGERQAAQWRPAPKLTFELITKMPLKVNSKITFKFSKEVENM
jgi:hypothetical protein